ncbi:TPA: hypothetical protein QCO08_002616 [Bacillus anthracis]|nr:hypothetical protein [Bacillus anthracis]
MNFKSHPTTKNNRLQNFKKNASVNMFQKIARLKKQDEKYKGMREEQEEWLTGK